MTPNRSRDRPSITDDSRTRARAGRPAMLTDLQRVVLVQLREHGCPWIADAAERFWNQGRRSYFDPRVRCPRWLWQLFHEANDGTMKAMPKRAEPSAANSLP